MIAPYLASFFVNLLKPDKKSQFRLIKDLNSKMYVFLIHENIPVTLYSNMLNFIDSNKSFKLDEDFLKTMTNHKFNVDHSNLQDGKIIRELVEKMDFDNENAARPSTRDKSFVKLLNSPAIMASGLSTTFLSSDPNELCDRIKLLIQGKMLEKIVHIINEDNVVIVDKLIEYNCLSKKQYEQILIKSNRLHTKKN